MKHNASPSALPEPGQRCFLRCSPSATGILVQYDPQNGQATVQWDRPGILAPQVLQRIELGYLETPDEILTLPEPQVVTPPPVQRPTPQHWQQVGREHLASVEQWLQAPSKKTRRHDLYLEPQDTRPLADEATQNARATQTVSKSAS